MIKRLIIGASVVLTLTAVGRPLIDARAEVVTPIIEATYSIQRLYYQGVTQWVIYSPSAGGLYYPMRWTRPTVNYRFSSNDIAGGWVGYDELLITAVIPFNDDHFTPLGGGLYAYTWPELSLSVNVGGGNSFTITQKSSNTDNLYLFMFGESTSHYIITQANNYVRALITPSANYYSSELSPGGVPNTIYLNQINHDYEAVYIYRQSLAFEMEAERQDVYNQGYDNGFNAGHDAGYTEGVAKAPTMLSDAFSVIKAGAEVVGTVVAINLMPGVSIGLLVSIPLIFGLMLWLIKLLRGGGD